MDEHATHPRSRLGIMISMFPELHETFILRELVALERRGVDFDIYSLQYPRDPITLEDAIRLTNERTTFSPLFSLATAAAFGRAVLQHPLRLASAIGQVIRFGYDRPMDIIKNLAILPIALHFGELGRKRGVNHWHGHWATIPTTACWFLQQVHGDTWSAAIHGEDIFSPNRFLQHKLDATEFSVVCSAFFCNHLKTELGLAEPEHVHLNYHGLEPSVLEHASRKRVREFSPEEPLLLISIGRLVPTKGHDVVIRACAALIASGRKLHLTLVGSGPLEAELKALVDQEGIAQHVDFRGALAFADVLDALDAADLFCLAPRLIAGEPPDGIPNVIAEAMALGLPVVTTRVSAIPELIVNGETGRLVEVDDVQAFAEAISSLTTDPVVARNMSHQAAIRVTDMFNQNQNIDDLLSLFEQHVPGGLQLTDTRSGCC